jgi:hypothetical protein
MLIGLERGDTPSAVAAVGPRPTPSPTTSEKDWRARQVHKRFTGPRQRYNDDFLYSQCCPLGILHSNDLSN